MRLEFSPQTLMIAELINFNKKEKTNKKIIIYNKMKMISLNRSLNTLCVSLLTPDVGFSI